jgi:hypothetical protein
VAAARGCCVRADRRPGRLWVDGDDVGRGALLERLRLLGAGDEAIASSFAYVLPEAPLELSERADLLEVVKKRKCRLAVVDGFNPLLALHKCDPNTGVDVGVAPGRSGASGRSRRPKCTSA